MERIGLGRQVYVKQAKLNFFTVSKPKFIGQELIRLIGQLVWLKAGPGHYQNIPLDEQNIPLDCAPIILYID